MKIDATLACMVMRAHALTAMAIILDILLKLIILPLVEIGLNK